MNWALEGLTRLLERGGFKIPETVAKEIQDFKDQGSAVSQFARTMLEASDDTKVARADVLCAFHGWLKEEDGDNTHLRGARWLMPKLRIARPEAIFRTILAMRFLCGVKLTDDALKHWRTQKDAAENGGRGSKGVSGLTKEVNRPWDPREE